MEFYLARYFGQYIIIFFSSLSYFFAHYTVILFVPTLNITIDYAEKKTKTKNITVPNQNFGIMMTETCSCFMETTST